MRMAKCLSFSLTIRLVGFAFQSFATMAKVSSSSAPSACSSLPEGREFPCTARCGLRRLRPLVVQSFDDVVWLREDVVVSTPWFRSAVSSWAQHPGSGKLGFGQHHGCRWMLSKRSTNGVNGVMSAWCCRGAAPTVAPAATQQFPARHLHPADLGRPQEPDVPRTFVRTSCIRPGHRNPRFIPSSASRIQGASTLPSRLASSRYVASSTSAVRVCRALRAVDGSVPALLATSSI